MARRLFIAMLVAGVLAQASAEESHNQQYEPQAFSYSHVIHNFGHSHAVAHPGQEHPPQLYSVDPVNGDRHLPYAFAVNVDKHVPYAFAVNADKHVPYAFTVPVVPVPQYLMAMKRPLTADHPFRFPVKYPVAAAVTTLIPVSIPKPYQASEDESKDHHEDEESYSENSSLEEDDESR